jgi:hypothetical protein
LLFFPYVLSFTNLFIIFTPYPASLPGDYLHVTQSYLEVAMKKIVRISVLSVLVLTAMALSAFNAMAMTPGSDDTAPVASATAEASLKQEVVGTVTAVDATSITLNGAVYTLTATTEIKGIVQVGDTVKLEIVTNADGSFTVREVTKPDSSGASTDVSGTEPASVDPVSTVEPTHTSDSVGSDNGHSTDSSSDKSGSSPDQYSKDTGNASGHDNSSGSSHPESVDTPSAPTGNNP